MGRIIAGVALIVLSFAVGAGAFGVALAKNLGAIAVAKGIGISLAIGGVSQLLSPVPTVPQGPNTEQDPRKSYSFSGVQNTSRQGVPVPVVYGETLVGSVVVSAGIDTVN